MKVLRTYEDFSDDLDKKSEEYKAETERIEKIVKEYLEEKGVSNIQDLDIPDMIEIQTIIASESERANEIYGELMELDAKRKDEKKKRVLAQEEEFDKQEQEDEFNDMWADLMGDLDE